MALNVSLLSRQDVDRLRVEYGRGEVRCTSHAPHVPGVFTVDHADPRIMMTTELARDLLGRPPEIDDMIRIRGTNREVIYRVVGSDLQYGRWLLEWPD